MEAVSRMDRTIIRAFLDQLGFEQIAHLSGVHCLAGADSHFQYICIDISGVIACWLNMIDGN